MSDKDKNPNYEETEEGAWRREGAPDATHESRVQWWRQDSAEKAREGTRDLREKQDQRNEEYRRRHGG